jgi:hypothetical protein
MGVLRTQYLLPVHPLKQRNSEKSGIVEGNREKCAQEILVLIIFSNSESKDM